MNNNFATVAAVLKSAKNIAFLPQPGSKEALCSALALALASDSRGQKSHVVSLDLLPAELISPAHNELLSSSFSQHQLVVSFDYNKAPIEKVDYRVEDGTFYLLASPIGANLQIGDVSVGFGDLGVDVLVTLGVGDLTALPKKLTKSLGELSYASHVSLGVPRGSFGEEVLLLPLEESGGISYLAYRLFSCFDTPPTPEMAKLLLCGMTAASGLQESA